MNIEVPQQKKGRKYDQVLEGARKVFMAEGFEGASVDLIAREAGVSKATLYSYFADKRALFAAVARAACERQTELAVDLNEDLPIAEMLRKGAFSFMQFMCSSFGQKMFRISIAESERFPEFGREFWQTGPMTGQKALAQAFDRAIDRGELVPHDTMLAASQLMEMCKADIFPRLIFNLIETLDPEDLRRVTDSAVETFMARYGNRQ